MTRVYDTGTVIGDHVLEELRGAGGFGEVWRARRLPDAEAPAHPDEPDVVALKVAADPSRAHSLAREAKLAAKLDHPAIVRTWRVLLDHEPAHLVMDLVRGTDLAQFLAVAGGKLTWQQAVAMLASVTDAVSHAHDRSIVHGDLKPANILIEDGTRRCVVSDFGLGRVLDARELSLSLSLSRSLTGIAGTLSYMAPELLEGATPNPSTDVYALGAVLYELITGTPPQGAFELPGANDWTLPDVLDDVLDACLAGDPMERPANAAALMELMSPLLDAAGIEIKQATRATTKAEQKAPRKEPGTAKAVQKVTRREPGTRSEGSCPRCSEPLARARYRGARTQACRKCQGLWLNRSALWTLVEEAMRNQMSPEVPTNVREDGGAFSALPCVTCDAPMSKLIVGAGSVMATVVDVCQGHGIWFDPGEIERTMETFTRSPPTATAVLSRLGRAIDWAVKKPDGPPPA